MGIFKEKLKDKKDRDLEIQKIRVLEGEKKELVKIN